MKGIADTGFIVAAGDRDDRHHEWAVSVAQSLTEPLLTCEAVLAEAAFHLRSTAYVLTLIEDGLLRVAFDCSGNLAQLRELAHRYADGTRTLPICASFGWANSTRAIPYYGG